MKRVHTSRQFGVLVAILSVATAAHADEIVEFDGYTAYGGNTDSAFATWSDVVGNVTTIGFTGLAQNELVREQYAELGAHFTSDWPDLATPGFPRDGWGIDGLGETEITFDAPINAFAVHTSQAVRFVFYLGDETLIETYWMAGGGLDPDDTFLGITTDMPFDRVAVYHINGSLEIDDVHFATVPAPGVWVVMAGLAGCRGRRRRA